MIKGLPSSYIPCDSPWKVLNALEESWAHNLPFIERIRLQICKITSLKKTFVMNLISSTLLHGIKWTILGTLSKTTNIESLPFHVLGSPSMKLFLSTSWTMADESANHFLCAMSTRFRKLLK